MAFWSCRKETWLERQGLLRNLWRHNLANKQLQYTNYPISHEVKTTRLWSVNRILIREIFFFRNHAKNVVGRLDPDLFLLFKKSLYEVNTNGLQLSFNIFRQPSTWHTIKTDCIKLYIQGWFFRKGSGNSFSTTFCVWFLKKNVSHVIFY